MPDDSGPTLMTLLDAWPRDRVALTFAGESWSYGRLDDAATAMAAHLRGLAGERVAFMLPNCPEAVLTYLACWRAGAIAVPLNTRFAGPEIERVLRRCRPRWLVVHATRVDRLDGVSAEVLAGTRLLTVGAADRGEPLEALLASGPKAHAGNDEVRPEDPAAIFFTSGSTGEPKGVVHTHRSVLGILDSTSAAMGGFTADDTVVVSDPLVHISGFMETMTALRYGARVPLLDGFDLQHFVETLRQERPTLVCTHLDVLGQLARHHDAHRDWFASFRGVYTGGDTVPGALQRDFADRFGLPIGVGWGMTEAIWLTVNRTPRPERDGCIGPPLDGVDVRRDDDTGELLVRGPMVMAGYWEDEPLTRATLDGGWLHTGDIGSRDADGVWWYEGRIKDLIVRRTSKITPGEVESAIALHPDVEAAAVVAAADPDEGQVPVAFVVRRPGSGLDAAGLLDFLGSRLAAYKHPARVHLVDALPLTASGKISHRDLHEPA